MIAYNYCKFGGALPTWGNRNRSNRLQFV